MDRENRESRQRLIDMLRDTASRIRELEAGAHRDLHERDDASTYRDKMHDKAELLMELPERATPLLTGIDTAFASDVRWQLQDYARRAGQAVGLGSVFYMAQLLYPEDHRDGEPNELERYIAKLEE